MSDLRAITFDAAGTLMVPHPSVGEIYAEALLSRGHSAEPGAIEGNFRKAFARERDRGPATLASPQSFWKGVVTESLTDFCPAEDLDLIFEDLWERFGGGDAWRLLNDVVPTLVTLRDLGFRLAVLSNNDTRLRRVLDELGIGHFFEHVFISWELGFEKPNPAIFRCVEAELGLSSSAFLHVGDNPECDLEAAHRAGWKAILVTQEEGPGLRIRGLAEMLGLVSTLSR